MKCCRVLALLGSIVYKGPQLPSLDSSFHQAIQSIILLGASQGKARSDPQGLSRAGSTDMIKGSRMSKIDISR
jgi:hypothetical protein